MNNRWLWLSKTFNSAPQKVYRLYEHFGDIDNIWEATYEKLMNVKGITLQDVKKILQNKSENVIKEVERLLLDKKVNWISIDQEDFPKGLKQIYDPPCVIYYRGELPDNNKIAIGVVGTRKASDYAKEVTKVICSELANNEVQVISGMARGIDTCAHIGALEATDKVEKGKTFAVLGCGVDLCYPAENIGLMKRLFEFGGVLSELLPGTPPQKYTFPLRNRIISGISEGILVVEASKKSGSLITADYALEHGKDIFVVPGRIYDINCEGSNGLFKQGAKPIFSSVDILEEYQVACKQLPFFDTPKILDNEENRIYDLVTLDPISVEDIVKETELEIKTVLLKLFNLEANGLIKQLWGRGYIKVLRP